MAPLPEGQSAPDFTLPDEHGGTFKLSADPKFEEMRDYMEWVSDQHPHKFRVEGDEIVVDTAA